MLPAMGAVILQQRFQHRRFERGGEWFDCIFRNRRAQDPLDADVAAGPIANDTLFDTLSNNNHNSL